MQVITKTMPKVATFFWSDEGEQAFKDLLAVFGEHRGKIDVLYDGDNYLVVTFEDGCLDGQIKGPFDLVIQESVEALMESMAVKTMEDLIDALAHDDEMISKSKDNPDDDDFAAALADV